MDGEGAPPGGPGAQAAAMRVNEKYSTLPAEDRSVHIINICAIEDIGYLPSEGTVSASGRERGGGPRTCAAPGDGGRGGRGCVRGAHRARGARPPASPGSAGPEPGPNAAPLAPAPGAPRLSSQSLRPGPGAQAREHGWGPGWDIPFLLVLAGAAGVGVGVGGAG